MKICIFEPHPDDLLFGPGPILIDWINQNNEIQVITVTDGRACYRKTKDKLDEETKNLTEDELAKIRINEAKQAIKFLGISPKNHFLLKFRDADGQKYVKEAIEKVKPLIEGADRIVLPSDNNSHVDHQATHDIAKKASQELKLKNTHYYVYFIPSYGKWREDSAQKQIEVKISEEKRKKLLEWLKIYQSQKKLKFTWRLFNNFLNIIEKAIYGVFDYSDMDQFYNF